MTSIPFPRLVPDDATGHAASTILPHASHPHCFTSRPFVLTFRPPLLPLDMRKAFVRSARRWRRGVCCCVMTHAHQTERAASSASASPAHSRTHSRTHKFFRSAVAPPTLPSSSPRTTFGRTYKTSIVRCRKRDTPACLQRALLRRPRHADRALPPLHNVFPCAALPCETVHCRQPPTCCVTLIMPTADFDLCL